MCFSSVDRLARAAVTNAHRLNPLRGAARGLLQPVIGESHSNSTLAHRSGVDRAVIDAVTSACLNAIEKTRMTGPNIPTIRTLFRRGPASTVACLLLATLAACGGDDSDPPMTTVTLTGWPNITGLTVTADGKAVANPDIPFKVSSKSVLSFSAAGIQLATLPARQTVTLFDLLPTFGCSSSVDLSKLLRLLLSLDSDQDPTNGISVAVATPLAQTIKLADLSESALLALETQLAGRNVPLATALLTANAALDQEAWTENVATRTSFVNDMTFLQNYLDRVLGAFALDPTSLDGFAAIAPSEVDRIPATLKNEGMAFDGATPVFSWRYGLQRTDASDKAGLTYPLALPQDIQAIYDTIGNKPDYGHIGDIDIANGKLYAPIEDEDNSQLQSYIAVYDAATLQYTGEKHALPLALHTDGVPWVAVDAARNQLYTVTWSGTAANSLNVFDLTTFDLLRSVPLQLGVDGRRVQGAKVHDGMIYASGDSHDPGAASGTKRKYLYKVDPVSGSVITLLSYDTPNRTEAEGLAFGPDGTLHVIVLDRYTTPDYAVTTNATPFASSVYSIDGDDWNPSSRLRHYTRAAAPVRDQLCSLK